MQESLCPDRISKSIYFLIFLYFLFEPAFFSHQHFYLCFGVSLKRPNVKRPKLSEYIFDKEIKCHVFDDVVIGQPTLSFFYLNLFVSVYINAFQ